MRPTLRQTLDEGMRLFPPAWIVARDALHDPKPRRRRLGGLLFLPLAFSCASLHYQVRVEDAPPYGIHATHYDIAVVTTAGRWGSLVSGVVFVQELTAEMRGYRGEELLFTMNERRLEAGATYERGEARDEQTYDARRDTELGTDRVELVLRGRLLRSPTLTTADIADLRQRATSDDASGIFSLHRTVVVGTGAHADVVRHVFSQKPIGAGDIELSGYEHAFDGAEPVMTFELRSSQRRDGPHHDFELRFDGPARVPQARSAQL